MWFGNSIRGIFLLVNFTCARFFALRILAFCVGWQIIWDFASLVGYEVKLEIHLFYSTLFVVSSLDVDLRGTRVLLMLGKYWLI